MGYIFKAIISIMISLHLQLNFISTYTHLHPSYPVDYYRYQPQHHLQEFPDNRYAITPWFTPKPYQRYPMEDNPYHLRPLLNFCLRTRTVLVENTMTYTSTSTTTTTISTGPGTPTALGYTYVNGLGWYKVYPTLVTFDAAKAICEADGAKMIVINSQLEVDKMVAMLTAKGAARGWVGLTDSATEGTILTIFGDPLSTTYQKWSLGEINNAADWDCVYMDAGVAGMAMYDCVNILSAAVCKI